MPDWLYHWELDWIEWWRAHPNTFWAATMGVLAVYVFMTILRRRR